MQREEQRIQLWKHTGYTMLIFLMLLEWLIPLRELQYELELASLIPLLIVIGCTLFTGLLHTSRIAVLLLRITVITVTTIWIYGSSANGRSPLLNLSDLSSVLLDGGLRVYTALFQDMSGYLNTLKHLDTLTWSVPSGEMRTILLLISVSVLASMVQSLVIKHHSVLWFSGFTLLYLIVMQGLAQTDASAGIIRLLAWTAVLISWLRLEDVTMRDPQYSRRAWPVRWWISTMAVSLGLLLGYMLWQQAYSWHRPIAWHGVEQWITQTAMAEKASGSTAQSVSRTGYGDDDTTMGAPVQDDDSILFHAISPERTYWKVETKRVYTGTGWIADADPSSDSSEAGNHLEQVDASGRLTEELSTQQEAAWSEPFTQTIKLEQPLSADNPLLFGGRPERLTMWLPTDDPGMLLQEQLPMLQYDVRSERYRYMPDHTREAAAAADQAGALTYSYQTRAIKDALTLTDTSNSQQQAHGTNRKDVNEMTEEQYQANTELPNTLPERVRQLAHEITQDASSQQNKVELIQAYLQQHYAYTKLETVTPPRGQDFVDHFLFDQRQGYCNHFSTAMVVLLRAEGIPARWVKGFAPGEEESSGRYTIRASDAHSWVEVYYPSAGWVPYEAVPPNSLAAFAAAGTVSMPALMPMKLEQQGNGEGLWAQITEWFTHVGTTLKEGGSKLVQAWEAIKQQLQAEWSYISDSHSWKGWLGSTGLPSWNEIKAQFLVWRGHTPLSTTFVLLLLLGIMTGLLIWASKAIHHAWPRWKLAYFIRAQQRNYTSERGHAMGAVAWQLIERRYGIRPSNMTYEQYAQAIASRLPLEEGEKLGQFAHDSTALLFARHHGERVQRQRFVRLCADMIPMCKQIRGKHVRRPFLTQRNPALEMSSNKRKGKHEDRTIEV